MKQDTGTYQSAYSDHAELAVLRSLTEDNRQPSGTFNAEPNLLESTIPQNLLGDIAVLNVLEESAHLCTVDY